MHRIFCDRCGQDCGGGFSELEVGVPLTSPMRITIPVTEGDERKYRIRRQTDLCSPCIDALEEWFKGVRQPVQ